MKKPKKQPQPADKNPSRRAFSLSGGRYESTFDNPPDYTGGFDADSFSPPMERGALYSLMFKNAQHSGIIYARANMVCSGLSSSLLSAMALKNAVLSLLIFGDVGLLKIRNQLGQVVRLEPLSGLYLRRRKTGGYSFTESYGANEEEKTLFYPADEVIFIKLPDVAQQVYGLPDYLGGIQAALLNADATRFRRRYFANGSHLGSIFYSTDPDMDDDLEKAVRQSLTESKGVGNFKSMFINIPNGHPDGFKVIPIGDTSRKDDFEAIKNVSAQDILTAHRFPAGLAGIIPNVGSIGNIEKIREAYRLDEVLPLQQLIAQTVEQDAEMPLQAVKIAVSSPLATG